MPRVLYLSTKLTLFDPALQGDLESLFRQLAVGTLPASFHYNGTDYYRTTPRILAWMRQSVTTLANKARLGKVPVENYDATAAQWNKTLRLLLREGFTKAQIEESITLAQSGQKIAAPLKPARSAFSLDFTVQNWLEHRVGKPFPPSLPPPEAMMETPERSFFPTAFSETDEKMVRYVNSLLSRKQRVPAFILAAHKRRLAKMQKGKK